MGSLKGSLSNINMQCHNHLAFPILLYLSSLILILSCLSLFCYSNRISSSKISFGIYAMWLDSDVIVISLISIIYPFIFVLFSSCISYPLSSIFILLFFIFKNNILGCFQFRIFFLHYFHLAALTWDNETSDSVLLWMCDLWCWWQLTVLWQLSSHLSFTMSWSSS